MSISYITLFSERYIFNSSKNYFCANFLEILKKRNIFRNLKMTFMINNHEKSVLEKFRLVMKDANVTDDTVLVRFLRARNLDIQKAENMLRKSLEWRRSNDIDSIKKFHLPPILVKNFKYYYCGDDFEGRPVLLMPIGKWDGKKIIGMGYKEEAGKFMYKICEILMDKCRAKGITQFQVIVDYNELTFWKIAHYASLETLLRVVINFEANFPETLFKTHFVNAPSVFWQAWKTVKPLLAQKTVDKIHIFDSDKHSRWTDHIIQHIPKESLPKEYGGIGCAMDFFPTYAEQTNNNQ